ncbi:hypothetical protein [Enterobacter hormaechei]|nr:hypothetical protein [Enterobacter hormaechei]
MFMAYIFNFKLNEHVLSCSAQVSDTVDFKDISFVFTSSKTLKFIFLSSMP